MLKHNNINCYNWIENIKMHRNSHGYYPVLYTHLTIIHSKIYKPNGVLCFEHDE